MTDYLEKEDWLVDAVYESVEELCWSRYFTATRYSTKRGFQLEDDVRDNLWPIIRDDINKFLNERLT